MGTQPRTSTTPMTAAPLGFGLLPAAVERPQPDKHARMGVQWTPIAGVTGGVTPLDPLTQHPAVAPTPEKFADYPQGFPIVETDPFLIYAGVENDLIGSTIEELQARARIKLALTASRWIEAGFWPQLTKKATPRLAATPQDPDIAIGLIEEWIGDVVGCQGVIHSPRRGIGVLQRYLTERSSKIQTRLGAPVAFGAGYKNLAPSVDGVAAPVAGADGVVWLYVTGPVLVNRSGIETYPGTGGLEAMDYPSNTAVTYATEVCSVGYEAGCAAVPVKFEVENP